MAIKLKLMVNIIIPVHYVKRMDPMRKSQKTEMYQLNKKLTSCSQYFSHSVERTREI